MAAGKPKNENRKTKRYNTELKVYFHFPYELETKVDYQITDKKHPEVLSPKYTGVSKNVSAEGLCFHSEKKLHCDDNLLIELFLPGDQSTVSMQGVVRWCRREGGEKGYDTGVKLSTVNGEPVQESIYFDETYQVEWSALLESVLGKFRVLSQKRKTNA